MAPSAKRSEEHTSELLSQSNLVCRLLLEKKKNPTMVAGVASRVLDREELLTSKLFVFRRERFDVADIAHIIYATRGKLYWFHILQLAGEHYYFLLWRSSH